MASANVPPDDRARYDELMKEADRCRDHATEAIDRGFAVGAREWMDACDSAIRAATALRML